MLGPKVYSMYTKPVREIIQHNGFMHHSYADDTQLYVSLKILTGVLLWLSLGNDDKSEIIVFFPQETSASMQKSKFEYRCQYPSAYINSQEFRCLV